MNQLGNICVLLAVLLSLYVVYVGFKEAIDKKRPDEPDMHVVQRQLRGFAHLMLAPVVLLIGVLVCGALFMNPEERREVVQNFGY